MLTFDAIILAGGEGRRMGGVDKPALQRRGRSLLSHALVAAGDAQRVVVVGPQRDLPASVLQVREEPVGAGPLAALAAGVGALHASGGAADAVVVLAADLPGVRPAHVVLLLRALQQHPGAGCSLAVDDDGRQQPLLAVYRTSRLLAALCDAGDPSGQPVRWLPGRLQAVQVPLPSGATADVDTPADWENVMLDDWVQQVCAALDLDPSVVDTALLLDVARDAAHGVARPAAPVTTFLLGLAAGQSGGDRAAIRAAADTITALVAQAQPARGGHRDVRVGGADGRGVISLAESSISPWRAIALRVAVAVVLLLVVVGIVYADRDGYRDSVDQDVSLIDAFYYSTVTLSTTGYGDIIPATEQARLINAVVITPLRVLFLILLVGTTLEALTDSSRRAWKTDRWRKTVQNHHVVVGFGVTGQSAARTLLNHGVRARDIVVVDTHADRVREANTEGFAAVHGDSAQAVVLERAGVVDARRVLISVARDDTAIMTTLTARRLAPTADIVVTVREQENVALMRQSGADSVVTSSESVGRILGLAAVSPSLGQVLEDLMTAGNGSEIAERDVAPAEEGQVPRALSDLVLAVVRDGQTLPYFDPGVGNLVRGDRLVVMRSAEDQPWAPRVGAETQD